MIPLSMMYGIGKYARFYSVNAGLPWSATETSLFTAANPPVVNGDWSAVTLTDPGDFEVDLTSTGVVVIDTGNLTIRQSFFCDVYDLSLRRWYGDTLEWVNNALPVYNNSLGVVQVTQGSAIVPIALSAATSDADGDALTYTIVGGSLPPGLTMDTAGNITGTP